MSTITVIKSANINKYKLRSQFLGLRIAESSLTSMCVRVSVYIYINPTLKT